MSDVELVKKNRKPAYYFAAFVIGLFSIALIYFAVSKTSSSVVPERSNDMFEQTDSE